MSNGDFDRPDSGGAAPPYRPEEFRAESGALVRLGLKLGLGKRGEYIAEYLDDRRARRISDLDPQVTG